MGSNYALMGVMHQDIYSPRERTKPNTKFLIKRIETVTARYHKNSVPSTNVIWSPHFLAVTFHKNTISIRSTHHDPQIWENIKFKFLYVFFNFAIQFLWKSWKIHTHVIWRLDLLLVLAFWVFGGDWECTSFFYTFNFLNFQFEF